MEGHELAVLEGARGLIAAQAPVFLVEAETRHRAGAPGDVFAFFAGLGYAGFFLHAGQARAVAEYHPALQDEALLTGYRRREEAGYVNNFIFLPPGVTPDQVAFYIELFKKVRATPDWKEFVEKGAFKDTFMTGKEFSDWLGRAESTHRTLMQEAGFIAK